MTALAAAIAGVTMITETIKTATIVKVRDRGVEPSGLHGGVRESLCPFDAVPINLKVRSKAYASGRAWKKDVCEIE